MSCDLKVTNESARCWVKISNYITKQFITYIKLNYLRPLTGIFHCSESRHVVSSVVLQ